jgi:hypothetical protein
MHLLEKLLPLQVNGAGLAGSTIGTVNVVSVPENHFLSAADIERVRAGLPYEHVPEPVQSALEPSNQPERMERAGRRASAP